MHRHHSSIFSAAAAVCVLLLAFYGPRAHALSPDEEVLGNGIDDDSDYITDFLRRPYFRGVWSVGVADWSA